jgi:succinate dehydrogenase hydrophobic anchor subunit
VRVPVAFERAGPVAEVNVAGGTGKFVVQAITGLVLIVVALWVVSLVIGLIKAAVSVAVMLLIGYAAWRLFKALFRA